MQFDLLSINSVYGDQEQFKLLLPTRKIYGIYHGSNFDYHLRAIKRNNGHVVCMLLSYSKFAESGCELEDYAQQAIAQMNKMTTIKKKKRVPQFGTLSLFQCAIIERSRDRRHIQIMAVTDDPKVKIFCRFGEIVENDPSISDVKEYEEKKRMKNAEEVSTQTEKVVKLNKDGSVPKKRGRPSKK